MSKLAQLAVNSANKSAEEYERALSESGVPHIATISQVATVLALSYSFIWSQVAQDNIKSTRCGWKFRLLRSDVAKWLANHR